MAVSNPHLPLSSLPVPLSPWCQQCPLCCPQACFPGRLGGCRRGICHTWGILEWLLLHHPHPGDTSQVQWGHLNAAINSQQPGLELHTHGVRPRLIPRQIHQILAELKVPSDLKPFCCLSELLRQFSVSLSRRQRMWHLPWCKALTPINNGHGYRKYSMKTTQLCPLHLSIQEALPCPQGESWS